MALDRINIGTSPNSGDGDKLRDAFIKVNDNYDNIYDKEEVDALFEDVDIDLADYDTSVEVDNKISTATSGLASTTYVDSEIQEAVSDLDIPTVTSDLINNSGFITLADIPTTSSNLDGVLSNGNTTNQDIIVGDLTLSAGDNSITISDNSENTVVVQKEGIITVGSYIEVDPTFSFGGEGKVTLATNSIGVLTVENEDGTNSTKFKFTNPTSNATITFPNSSGTVAFTSQIDSFIEEAPEDSKQYGRRNGAWTEINTSAPDPGTQNFQLVGANGYKTLVSTVNGISSWGTNAIHLGRKTTSTSATLGSNSLSLGSNTVASGQNSIASGNGSKTDSSNSYAFGQLSEAKHTVSFVFGNNVQSARADGAVFGRYNAITGSATDALFIVGNGTSNTARTNALEVSLTGLVLAPNCSVSEIDAATNGRVLATKEWVESKLTPGAFIAMLQNANPTEIDEIKTLLGIV